MEGLGQYFSTLGYDLGDFLRSLSPAEFVFVLVSIGDAEACYSDRYRWQLACRVRRKFYRWLKGE